ncbi:syntaxin-31-like [Brassica rapa]|uniref:syntaxin-31-like n=1 Tax=Brassica campestris TaxID=3711 RepID=UPI0004F195DB|nr:syntaxin-31-like [Brassica rapa]XP_013652248.1 syntaxin-31-like [Brassica napus]XP_022546195.1 syntaxin-31-like [Brassica napus]
MEISEEEEDFTSIETIPLHISLSPKKFVLSLFLFFCLATFTLPTFKKIRVIPSVHQAEGYHVSSKRHHLHLQDLNSTRRLLRSVYIFTKRLRRPRGSLNWQKNRPFSITGCLYTGANSVDQEYITGLKMALSDLQTLQNMEIADGSYSHDKFGHYRAVCDDLKTRLMGATKQFDQDVPTVMVQ